jgi:DNA-binding YbaB/EbfC family protein
MDLIPLGRRPTPERARSRDPADEIIQHGNDSNVFNQLGMLAELMRNAGKLRESFESLGEIEVEGKAGGGAVTAKVNGRLEVVSVRIEPTVLADGDIELLEDLVAAAVNAGLAKSREALAKKVATLAGGLPLGLVPGAGGVGSPPDAERGP